MPKQISQKITINGSITDVFHALITPSAIRQGWRAASAIVIPETG